MLLFGLKSDNLLFFGLEIEKISIIFGVNWKFASIFGVAEKN